MSKGTLVKSLIKEFTDNGSGGGNIGTGDYNVKVIDYDGTIIAEKNLDEGKTFKLPKAPSHDGLVFQEWSSTQEIVNGKITVGKNDVMIGAIYTTASGKNEFDITLTTITGLSVTLNIDGDKDWGDGTTDSLTSHTYSQVGKYTIKCNGTTMIEDGTNGIFGQNSSSANKYCTAIRLATIETTIPYAFFYCNSLSFITFSNALKEIGGSLLQYSRSLFCVVLPTSIISIGQNVFAYCNIISIIIPYGLTSLGASFLSNNSGIEKVILPNSITAIGTFCFNGCKSLKSFHISESLATIQYMFGDCNSLQKIKIPKSVTTVGTSQFNNCFSLIEYDFSEATSIPTLSNVNAFNNINAICKIKVPSALYDEWIEEANWVTFADYIVAV